MKHLAFFGMMLGLATLSSLPAIAHNLTAATATTDCTGFCLTVSADSLTPGEQDNIQYTFTLTSASGTTLTVSGEIDFTVDDSGTFSTTQCGNWLSSGVPLSDNFTGDWNSDVEYSC